MAKLDDLSVHSARLLPDVFPLPAGDVAVSVFGLRAAPGAWHRIRGPAASPGGNANGTASCRAGAMTAHSETLARPRSGRITAMLIVALPLVLALTCVLAPLGLVHLPQHFHPPLLSAF